MVMAYLHVDFKRESYARTNSILKVSLNVNAHSESSNEMTLYLHTPLRLTGQPD